MYSLLFYRCTVCVCMCVCALDLRIGANEKKKAGLAGSFFFFDPATNGTFTHCLDF